HFLDPDSAGPAPENEALEKVVVDTEEEAERMITVARCSLAAQAHAMRVQLEAAGIPVFLADELTVAMDWLLSNAIGGVKVQVPERCAPPASRLLEGIARSDAIDEAMDEADEEE